MAKSLDEERLDAPKARTGSVRFAKDLDGQPLFMEEAIIERIAPKSWLRMATLRERANKLLQDRSEERIIKEDFHAQLNPSGAFTISSVNKI